MCKNHYNYMNIPTFLNKMTFLHAFLNIIKDKNKKEQKN